MNSKRQGKKSIEKIGKIGKIAEISEQYRRDRQILDNLIFFSFSKI